MVKAKLLTRWWKCEEGATAIEYVLIAGAMALALIPALSSTTTGVAQLWQSIIGSFAAVTS